MTEIIFKRDNIIYRWCEVNRSNVIPNKTPILKRQVGYWKKTKMIKKQDVSKRKT